MAVGGADVRAAERRVEHLDAALAQSVGYLNGQLRRRAAQIDKNQTFLVRRAEAVLTAGNFFHILRLQRRQDLAQVSASFAYLDGKSGLEAARTTELMGRVLQASERR